MEDEVWIPEGSTDIVSSNKVQLLSRRELSSIKTSVIEDYWNVFRSKEVLIWQAQGLP